MTERSAIENTTLPISENSREIVAKMKNHNLLALGKGENDMNNKDIYLLAVAMGLDNPTEQMIKPESWTRVVNFSEKDKALIISALLGTAGSTDEIEEYCDLNNAISYCKKFTDAGFEEIDRIAADVKYNPELLVRKMLNYVDEIYDDVVGNLLDKDETI